MTSINTAVFDDVLRELRKAEEIASDLASRLYSLKDNIEDSIAYLEEQQDAE